MPGRRAPWLTAGAFSVGRTCDEPGLATADPAVHGGHAARDFGETSEALFLTSGFCYERAEDAEARFAENAARLHLLAARQPDRAHVRGAHGPARRCRGSAATASGMAAVHCGPDLPAAQPATAWSAGALFGSCHYILTSSCRASASRSCWSTAGPRRLGAGAAVRPADARFPRDAGQPDAGADRHRRGGELAHRAGAEVIVDNVFATPILQQPLELGADVVVYSATKHIDGQGRCLGGAILCAADQEGRAATLPRKPARRSARSTPGSC